MPPPSDHSPTPRREPTGAPEVVHAVVHEDVGTAIYAVIPPRPVPLGKRLFWRLVLRLLRSPRGRAWLAARYRVPPGG